MFGKLLDLIIKLGEVREKNNEKKLDQIVKPIVEEFKKLHSEYLSSFEEYKRLIQKDTNIEEVVKRIQHDRLFGDSKRIDIILACMRFKDPVYSQLFEAMEEYLTHTDETLYKENSGRVPQQKPRSDLADELLFCTTATVELEYIKKQFPNSSLTELKDHGRNKRDTQTLKTKNPGFSTNLL